MFAPLRRASASPRTSGFSLAPGWAQILAVLSRAVHASRHHIHSEGLRLLFKSEENLAFLPKPSWLESCFLPAPRAITQPEPVNVYVWEWQRGSFPLKDRPPVRQGTKCFYRKEDGA